MTLPLTIWASRASRWTSTRTAFHPAHPSRRLGPAPSAASRLRKSSPSPTVDRGRCKRGSPHDPPGPWQGWASRGSRPDDAGRSARRVRRSRAGTASRRCARARIDHAARGLDRRPPQATAPAAQAACRSARALSLGHLRQPAEPFSAGRRDGRVRSVRRGARPAQRSAKRARGAPHDARSRHRERWSAPEPLSHFRSSRSPEPAGFAAITSRAPPAARDHPRPVVS